MESVATRPHLIPSILSLLLRVRSPSAIARLASIQQTSNSNMTVDTNMLIIRDRMRSPGQRVNIVHVPCANLCPCVYERLFQLINTRGGLRSIVYCASVSCYRYSSVIWISTAAAAAALSDAKEKTTATLPAIEEENMRERCVAMVGSLRERGEWRRRCIRILVDRLAKTLRMLWSWMLLLTFLDSILDLVRRRGVVCILGIDCKTHIVIPPQSRAGSM